MIARCIFLVSSLSLLLAIPAVQAAPKVDPSRPWLSKARTGTAKPTAARALAGQQRKRAKVRPSKPSKPAVLICDRDCERILALTGRLEGALASQVALQEEVASLLARLNTQIGPDERDGQGDSWEISELKIALGEAEGDLAKLSKAVSEGLDPSLVQASTEGLNERVAALREKIEALRTLSAQKRSLRWRVNQVEESLARVDSKVKGLSYAVLNYPDSILDRENTDTKDAAPIIEPTASFFSRYEVRENYSALGKNTGRISESDEIRYRARLGLRTTPIDIGRGRSVIVSFAPQASGVWGDKGGTLSDGQVNLHSAKLRLLGDGYWVDSGRFEMKYGEHLVIGNVDWHETARSFDGVRAHASLGKDGSYIDAFATQVAENLELVKPFGAGDQYFVGAYAGFGPALAEDLELDTYALGQVWPKTGGAEPSAFGMEVTLGSRVKKDLGAVDLRGEGGLQFGLGRSDVLAYQGDAEVGVSLGAGCVRLASGAWYASGDDPSTRRNEAWDQLYPTAHKFMGFADILGGRSNVTGGIARVRVKASAQWKLGTDAHAFFRPQTADGVDSYTGFELDSWALHKIGKGLGLRGGYSVFAPNSKGPYGTGKVAHYVEVQLRYDLK